MSGAVLVVDDDPVFRSLARRTLVAEGLRSADSDRATTVLDLDEVTLIDIAGARTLRAAAGEARQRGRRLIAVNARPDVEKWLRLMGLDRQLKLVSTLTS
jgi:anti-anti-sigma factor